jgi:hypothetical protein
LELQWKARLDRARYEAQLAERRYKAVDPDNRVVARTLEGEWETKLRELNDLEKCYADVRSVERLEISDDDRRSILSLAKDLPRVWSASTTTNVQRKNLLRTLVQNIALTPLDVPVRTTNVKILWHTGMITEGVVERPRYVAGSMAAEEIVQEIRSRVGSGWMDREIAEDLNRRGIASATHNTWTEQSVRGVRKRRRIRSQHPPLPRGKNHPSKRSDGLFSVHGLAARLGVSQATVRRWVKVGELMPVGRRGSRSTLWFELTPELMKRSRRRS